MQLQPGTWLANNKYVLVEKVDEDGPLQYWQARWQGPSFESGLVCLQIPHTTYLQHQERVTFLKVLDQLHPPLRNDRILAVLQVETNDDQTIAVYEPYVGHNLYQIRQHSQGTQGVFHWRTAVSLVSKVCLALHAAHMYHNREGHPAPILHGDLRPENVILTPQGRLKLRNFGNFNLWQDLEETWPETIRRRQAYAAPERWNGQGLPITQSMDLFGLGVLLFELITSRLPFEGQQAALIRQAIPQGPISLTSHSPSVPKDLEVLIACLLSTNPNERPTSVRDLHLSLESLLQRTGPVVAETAFLDLYNQTAELIAQSDQEDSLSFDDLPIEESHQKATQDEFNSMLADLADFTESLDDLEEHSPSPFLQSNDEKQEFTGELMLPLEEDNPTMMNHPVIHDPVRSQELFGPPKSKTSPTPTMPSSTRHPAIPPPPPPSPRDSEAHHAWDNDDDMTRIEFGSSDHHASPMSLLNAEKSPTHPEEGWDVDDATQIATSGTLTPTPPSSPSHDASQAASIAPTPFAKTNPLKQTLEFFPAQKEPEAMPPKEPTPPNDPLKQTMGFFPAQKEPTIPSPAKQSKLFQSIQPQKNLLKQTMEFFPTQKAPEPPKEQPKLSTAPASPLKQTLEFFPSPFVEEATPLAEVSEETSLPSEPLDVQEPYKEEPQEATVIGAYPLPTDFQTPQESSPTTAPEVFQEEPDIFQEEPQEATVIGAYPLPADFHTPNNDPHPSPLQGADESGLLNALSSNVAPSHPPSHSLDDLPENNPAGSWNSNPNLAPPAPPSPGPRPPYSEENDLLDDEPLPPRSSQVSPAATPKSPSTPLLAPVPISPPSLDLKQSEPTTRLRKKPSPPPKKSRLLPILLFLVFIGLAIGALLLWQPWESQPNDSMDPVVARATQPRNRQPSQSPTGTTPISPPASERSSEVPFHPESSEPGADAGKPTPEAPPEEPREAKKERQADDKTEKLAQLKADKERKAREKAEKLAQRKAEKAEKLAQLKADKERKAREKAEKRKADKERKAREKAEKIAQLKAEKERKAREQAEKRKADKERRAREKAEKLAKQRESKNQNTKERLARLTRQKTERQRREKEARKAKERLRKLALERKKREKERLRKLAAQKLALARKTLKRTRPKPKAPTPRPAVRTPARVAVAKPTPKVTGIEVNFRPGCVLFMGRARLGNAFPKLQILLDPGNYGFRCVNTAAGLSHSFRLIVRKGKLSRYRRSFGLGRVLVQSEPWSIVYGPKGRLGRSGKILYLVPGKYRLLLYKKGNVIPGPGNQKTIRVHIVQGKLVRPPKVRFP